MSLWAWRLRPLSRTENKMYYFYNDRQNTLNLFPFLFFPLVVLHRKRTVCYDSVTSVHVLCNIISCYLFFLNTVNQYKFIFTLFWCDDATMLQDINLSCHRGMIMNRQTEFSWSMVIAKGLTNCKSIWFVWQIVRAQSGIRYLDLGLVLEELWAEEDSVRQSEAGRSELLTSSAHMDLPFMNPCWLGLIPWLSFTCLVSALRMNRSTIFPGIEVRLTGL